MLEARQEEVEGKPFTSAMLDSSGKVSVKYGMIETRVSIPELNRSVAVSILTTYRYYYQQ